MTPSLQKDRTYSITTNSTPLALCIAITTGLILCGPLPGISSSAQRAPSFTQDIVRTPESSGAIKVTVTLDKAAETEVSFNVTTSSKTAYGPDKGYQSVEEGIVYGTGLDLNLKETTLRFGKGEKEKDIFISIVDDSLFEADETLDLVISDHPKAKCTIAIIDDDRPALVDVCKDFGAKGDGTHDDTAAIQEAVNAVHSKGGGVILFPEGKTFLITSIDVFWNITYHGYGAVLKRKKMQGKFSRMFTSRSQWLADSDSPPLIFKGLTLDGNNEHQGPYDQWQMEHQHCIFLMGNPGKKGMLKAFVEDCVFQNNTADGVSIYTNANVTVFDCEAYDVFRGGYVITGGHTKSRVYRFKTDSLTHHPHWSTGIDLEVDGPGYKGSMESDVVLDGLQLLDGDFDFGYAGPKRAYRVTSPNTFYCVSKGTKSVIKDSQFGVAGQNGFMNRIVWPQDVLFDNCKLTAMPFPEGQSSSPSEKKTDPYLYACIEVWWNFDWDKEPHEKNQKVELRNCEYFISPELASSPKSSAFKFYGDDAANKNSVHIQNGVIHPGFQTGMILQGGITYLIEDITIDSKTGIWFNGTAWAKNTAVLKAELRNIRFNNEGQLRFDENNPRWTITFKDIVVLAASNHLRADQGLDKINFIGSRRILGTSPPSPSTHGLVGDTYQLKANGKTETWKCTQAGYLKQGMQVSSAWKKDVPTPE